MGCGFGGFSLLSRLRPGLFDSTLASRSTTFLFTPLLPSAATGTVEFRSILEPARRRLRHVRVLDFSAERLDAERRVIQGRSPVTGESVEVPYDILVIAVGSAVSGLDIPGIRDHAHLLKTVDDARRIRLSVLDQFAAAELPGLDEAEIRRRLTFVICGAGPTGIEVAAEIQDLIVKEARLAFPSASKSRVIILEARDQILSSFDRALAEYARGHIQGEGIEIRLSSPIESVADGFVRLSGGHEIPCGLVLWAGGNGPQPFVDSLPLEKIRGRIVTDSTLRVPALTDVYALGDCAVESGSSAPATAQLAQQQGYYLAKALARRRRGKPVAPFRFRSKGMLAYIGAGQALADLRRVKWSGRGAWWLWRSAYLTRLVSLANKTKVLFDWIKARLFGRDLSRF